MDKKKEKLFGFNLVDASALLLFISAVFMLLFGLYELYLVLVYYNETGEILVVSTIILIVCFAYALYVIYKTVQHRKKNP